MDIGKAFTFVFEDPEWIQKVLIGGLVTLGATLLSPIIIGLFFLFVLEGYAIDLLKNVRDGVEHPLPRWDNWGDKAVKGIKVSVIFLIWALPIILISILSALFSAILGGGELEELVGVISLCLSCISMIWGILLALVSPAILIRFAETEEISAGFQFGEILAFTRDNIGDIIIALLASIVAGIVAAIAGTILCLIGVLFTVFWSSMVEFHLFGQIARRARETTEVVSVTV